MIINSKCAVIDPNKEPGYPPLLLDVYARHLCKIFQKIDEKPIADMESLLARMHSYMSKTRRQADSMRAFEKNGMSLLTNDVAPYIDRTMGITIPNHGFILSMNRNICHLFLGASVDDNVHRLRSNCLWGNDWYIDFPYSVLRITLNHVVRGVFVTTSVKSTQWVVVVSNWRNNSLSITRISWKDDEPMVFPDSWELNQWHRHGTQNAIKNIVTLSMIYRLRHQEAVFDRFPNFLERRSMNKWRARKYRKLAETLFSVDVMQPPKDYFQRCENSVEAEHIKIPSLLSSPRCDGRFIWEESDHGGKLVWVNS